MLLYWGIFTLGFLVGSILTFVTFAPKKPEDDPQYEMPSDYTQGIQPTASQTQVSTPLGGLSSSAGAPTSPLIENFKAGV